jgi:1-pyrroline-5-carboxylate dehydrogenase
MLSNYLVYKIYREAGLPAGIINFVPADGPVFGDTVTKAFNNIFLRGSLLNRW